MYIVYILAEILISAVLLEAALAYTLGVRLAEGPAPGIYHLEVFGIWWTGVLLQVEIDVEGEEMWW